jgi:hypothetical protein
MELSDAHPAAAPIKVSIATRCVTRARPDLFIESLPSALVSPIYDARIVVARTSAMAYVTTSEKTQNQLTLRQQK